jgi:hypothetical protein
VARLGFFTQHELDAVVGYARRRQRLVKSKVLPPGQRIKTFGQEPIVFPEFAAAGLVVARPDRNDEALLAEVRSASELLYRTESFAALVEVLRTALRGRRGWKLEDLVAALVDRAADDLHAWRAQVLEAERALAEAGIRLRIDVARIEDVTASGYRIALAETGETVTCGINAARRRLPRGLWVTRDLVEFGARSGELLVPSVAPEVLALIGEDDSAAESDEADWGEMFRNIAFEPVAVPMVSDDDMVGSNSSRGDLVRPKRRLTVRAERALYANANTMARSPRSARPR